MKKISIKIIVTYTAVVINALLLLCGLLNVISLVLAFLMFPLTENIAKSK